MKLLYDENLSPKLIHRLADIFPDARHVDRVGLGEKHDFEIWEYAKEHGFTIVSKDSDFHEKTVLSGYPPKIVWIRRGNCSVSQIEKILRKHETDIINLHQNNDLSFLILY